MKTVIRFFAAILLFSVPFGFAHETDQPHTHDAPQYKAKSPKLTRAQIDEWLAKPDQVVFIDLRRPDELTKIGGLPVYLSIQAADLEKYLAFVPKDRTVITLSNHAGRAGRGADLLVSKGYKVAGAAGVQDYEAEGGSLLKIVPPVPKQ